MALRLRAAKLSATSGPNCPFLGLTTHTETAVSTFGPLSVTRSQAPNPSQNELSPDCFPLKNGGTVTHGRCAAGAGAGNVRKPILCWGVLTRPSLSSIYRP